MDFRAQNPPLKGRFLHQCFERAEQGLFFPLGHGQSGGVHLFIREPNSYRKCNTPVQGSPQPGVVWTHGSHLPESLVLLGRECGGALHSHFWSWKFVNKYAKIHRAKKRASMREHDKGLEHCWISSTPRLCSLLLVMFVYIILNSYWIRSKEKIKSTAGSQVLEFTPPDECLHHYTMELSHYGVVAHFSSLSHEFSIPFCTV